MRLEKHSITNFHISFDGNSFKVQLFQKEKQGSTLYWFEDAQREIIWYSSDHSREKILNFLEKLHYHEEETLANIYNLLGGAFELFIYDKNKNNLIVISDLYGVNGSFSLRLSDTLHFFLNFQNFEVFNVPLEFDYNGLQAHFAFGYQVKPFSLPYKNIVRLHGGTLHEFNSSLVYNATQLSIQFSEETPSFSLKQGIHVANQLFFGATAGKDSLALLSQVEKHAPNVKTGNFGKVYSADVVQGKEIAVNLEVAYQHTTLCDEEEFMHYAYEIANISGGLGTISYVDMLKFVDQGIPPNYSYVMGEAGECVRMFFPEETNLVKALHNYLTPKEFLVETFQKDFYLFLQKYPENISAAIIKNYKGNSNAEILINFYRNGRLPGNFGNRHKLLSVYRDKITPFLHEDFIKQTHHLPLNRYKNDEIHKEIIYTSNQDLLAFFRNPIQSDVTVQDWNHRISNEIGVVLYKLLQKHIHSLKEVFDTQKVLELARQQQKNPNRGLYFLFRILSMAIFVDNINNAVAPCEKR